MSAAGPQARGVNTASRADPVEIDDFGDQVARRARHIRHDRPRMPDSALNKLDLPTLGLPTIASCSPSRTSRPRRPSATQDETRADQLDRARRQLRAG